MTLAFDNRALLPLAVLIALPLLLHLFARSRPPQLLFGSTELLRRAVRSTIRLRRPKDWLLLVLRTLLVAAVVGLFLRPVLFSGRQTPVAGAGRHVVVIVDATASMNYAEGGQTRFGAACAEAEQVLRGMGSRDTANVVWLRAEPAAVFPEMASNMAALHDALRRASAYPEAGNPAAAVALSLELLRSQTGRREIVMISDFQRTTWSQPPSVPPDITLSYLRVGVGDAPNATVAAVTVQPITPLVGEALTVIVGVRNFAATPVTRTVFLAAGETRQSRSVVLPPWGAASATFALSPAVGALSVEVHLDEDAFPGDDGRWLVVTMQPHLRIGIIGDDLAYAPVWTHALRSLNWTRVLPVTVAEITAGTAAFDVLMVAGWDGSGAEALQAAARGGCTLIVAPAPGVTLAALTGLLGHRMSSTATLMRETQPEGLALVCRRPDDPLLRVFENGARGDPVRTHVRSRLRLAPEALSAGDVILAYADGVPALARHTAATGGVRWLWNVPLDTASGAFALQPEFVCLLGEMLLTSRIAPLRDDMETPSGQRVWRPSAALGTTATLVDNAGNALSVMTEHGRLASVVPPLPGIYRWLCGGECEAYAVVNFPTEESDLRTMPPGAVRTAGAAVAGSGGEVRRLRDGLPLWPWLLAAVVVFCLLEVLVALWAQPRRRKVPS